MKLSIVGSLLAKDLSQFFKNRFVALITFLGMAFYIVFYFLTPVKVNETYKVGIYAGSMKHVFEQYSQSAEEGLEVSMLETEELLIESVAHEKFVVGIAFPEDILKPLPSVKKPEIHVYFPPHAMKEIRDGLKMLMGELVSVLKKEPFPVEIRETVLGNDMMGKQVSPRFKMRIMLAFVLLMLETFGLANLIAEEKEKGTMQAVLVTPATSTDVFVAKGITGVSLALLQAVFFLIIAGGLQQQPGIILLTLFLGAIMFTGLAFLIATKAKDFMTVIAWGFTIIIVFALPAMGIMIPGMASGWIKVIPSYFIVDTLDKVTCAGGGWSDISSNLLALLVSNVIILSLGIIALKRKIS